MSQSHIVQSLIHCERANVQAKIIEFDGFPTCATLCDQYPATRKRPNDPITRKARKPQITYLPGPSLFSDLTPIIRDCQPAHPNDKPRYRSFNEVLAAEALEPVNAGSLESKRISSRSDSPEMPSLAKSFGGN